MENFKQIAEDCLAGKLSGIFVLRNGSKVNSNHLKKLDPSKHLMCSYSLGGCWIYDNGNAYGETGYLHTVSIINFIPDMKKEQITIDIPEGMTVIREETPGEIKIKFIKKPLDYYTVVLAQKDKHQFIHVTEMNEISKSFNKKAEVLSKLTNIRNYFGKPAGHIGYTIIQSGVVQISTCYSNLPIFAKKEHAEQAIKILGDELKYLFEPW